MIIALIYPINIFSDNLTNDPDTVPLKQSSTVKTAIYNDSYKQHGSHYNKIWGEHYRKLYYTPITARSVSLETLYGGLKFVDQIPQLHAVVFEDNTGKKYMVKPMGGSSSFLESGFFRDIFKIDDFRNTYIGDFVKEAYTIIHPYSFIVSDELAGKAGLNSNTTQIVYFTGNNYTDTIADGTNINNKLSSISQFPQYNSCDVITDIEVLLAKLQSDPKSRIDRGKYIRTRLFDMLIGDWNKIPENWAWNGFIQKDSTIIYEPDVIDRSYAFAKVDGTLFKQLLEMLGLNFITNYESEIKDIKRINKLGFALDIALTNGSSVNDWISEAAYLRNTLSNIVIDQAFSLLPDEMKNEQADILTANIKSRREKLQSTAIAYYNLLQQTPVITGTNANNRFLINNENNNLRIQIYTKEKNDSLIFDKTYNKSKTKEIWLYGLNGDDSFESVGENKHIPLLLIGGKGMNNYSIENGRNISIIERKTNQYQSNTHSGVKIIYPNDTNALAYDYEKVKYTKWSFTPIGVFDSDLGLNLGTSVAYTVYGFKRMPYTRWHQFSFDYVNGITYQGIFPDYNHRKSIHLYAYIGSPAYFSNFFGFGNETPGYKNEKDAYNRVNINKYIITPGFYYSIDSSQTINLNTSFELYKVKNPKNKNRLINKYYEDDSDIFKSKYFFDASISYQLDKEQKHFISSYKAGLTAGWKINIAEPGRNFPYLLANLGINLSITDKITFATLMKGKTIFTDKYEFYQSATTELRGFRNKRFTGKHSFYQYTDIRYDMGELQNPLAPVTYGFFVGVDHGRVWYPGESSKKWHSSYGGGIWLSLFKKFTGKFSYFASSDTGRFTIELGMGF